MEAYAHMGLGWVAAQGGELEQAVRATQTALELSEAIGAAEEIGGTSVGGISEPRACINGPDGGSGTYTVAIAWRGLTRLSDSSVHTCGQGTGVYDTADGAQADVYRRVLLVNTFISVPP